MYTGSKQKKEIKMAPRFLGWIIKNAINCYRKEKIMNNTWDMLEFRCL